MVEFRFDIKPLFPQSIVRVTSSLLPHTFRGDRRQALDVTSKMTEIIDELGQLSAVSQKLTKPVTSAQRLRKNDNQVIYLLADVNEGRNGKVLGLLKVGKKDLYLFDEAGNSRKIEHTPCILDFYVHESRQRSGLGKHMFETMLTEEKWLPVKCSVDRPSDKLLGFLKKHYGLERIIPQANNFVLYDGFFQDESISQKYTGNREQANIMHITNSPNTQLFGAHYTANESLTRESRKLDNGGIITLKSQIIQQQNKQQNAPNGRYGAPRPHCSMAEIIHSGAVPVKRDAQTGRIHHDTVDLIGQNFAEMAEKMQQVHVSEQYYREHENDQKPEIASIINDESNVENEPPQEEFSEPQMHEDLETNKHSEQDQNNHYAKGVDNDNIGCVRKPTTFTLSKQHTGMKNRSFGVGMAVTPTQNMEFNQGDREDFNMIKVHRPIGSKLNSPPGDAQTDINDAMSTTSSGGEGLTEQGYHDLKFFHNRLW